VKESQDKGILMKDKGAFVALYKGVAKEEK
jgi:hypothetical protein